MLTNLIMLIYAVIVMVSFLTGTLIIYGGIAYLLIYGLQ